MIDGNPALEAIRERVCSVCCKPGPDGACHLTAEERCAIERFLPELEAIALSVTDRCFESYVDALRATVCRSCRAGGDPYCAVRDGDGCMIEKYFPLIIEAIDSVHHTVV